MSVLRKVLFVLIAAGAFGFIYANCEMYEEELNECLTSEGTGEFFCDVEDYYAIVSDLYDEGCLDDMPEL